MEIKIITVLGEINRGKTTLIKYVFEKLKNLGAEIIFYKKTGAYFEDFYATLIISGKKIVITSIGDESESKDKIDDADKKTLSGNPVNEKFIYIQRGIVLYDHYKADILINVLSFPKDCSEEHKNQIKNDYKQLLTDNGWPSNYTPIEMTHIEPGDYTPIITLQKKCEEIFTNIFEPGSRISECI